MDTGELELFARSLKKATNDYTGTALDTALEELGWHDAMPTEPRAAISTLFGFQGATNATSSALSHIFHHALGLRTTSPRQVVFPAIGRWDPPGTLDAPGLSVNGLASAALDGSEFAVVVARVEGVHTALEVPMASLSVVHVAGVDPHSGLSVVTGENIGTYTELGPTVGTWNAAVALARLAIAHELVGASRRMLELARAHAVERMQFGRPISSFQAIRHRLADTLVAIEMADALLDAAWSDVTPDAAAMAKAMAGRQARTTARHCQQVLAGIGFTTEHPFHLSFRRTLVLDGLFGSSASLTKAQGEEMLGTAELPPLLAL
jgi:hypothetical protein